MVLKGACQSGDMTLSLPLGGQMSLAAGWESGSCWAIWSFSTTLAPPPGNAYPLPGARKRWSVGLELSKLATSLSSSLQKPPWGLYTTTLCLVPAAGGPQAGHGCALTLYGRCGKCELSGASRSLPARAVGALLWRHPSCLPFAHPRGSGAAFGQRVGIGGLHLGKRWTKETLPWLWHGFAEGSSSELPGKS